MVQSFSAFSVFVEQLADQPTQSPLNHVAIDYWHDYQSGKPIDGGAAFASVLRQITLDGSLLSLAMLDQFLDKIKPHLASDVIRINQKIDQRNLLIFIAFYAGLVLVYQANQAEFANINGLSASLNWTSFAQLCQMFPPLQRLIDDDFSYSMAVSLLSLAEHTGFVPAVISDSVFFPLVTIIERLYPQRQNPLTSVAPNFGYLGDSLVDSVSQLLKRWQNLSLQPTEMRLPNEFAKTVDAVKPASPQSVATALPASLLSDLDNPLMKRKDWQADNVPMPMTQAVATHFEFVVPNFRGLSMGQETVLNEAKTASLATASLANLANDSLATPTPVNTTNKTTSKTANKTNNKTDTLNQTSQLSSMIANRTATSAREPAVKTSHQKLDTRSLSGRKAIKIATAQAKQLAREQAKQLAREQAEQAAQLAKEAEAKRQAEIAEALANPRINEKLLNQRKSLMSETPVLKDSFTELESDLQTPNLPDGLAENIKVIYQQALAVLCHAESVQAPKALAVVQKLADAKMSDAMLHLALWQLRGRADLGLEQNNEQGIAWVKKAAQLQDNRAEKLLSKLYFSGEIVGLDSELGKFWLAQAAAHGHREAKRLQQSFGMVSTLKETRQDEDNYLKKLAIGTAVLLLFAVIIIVAVKI